MSTGSDRPIEIVNAPAVATIDRGESGGPRRTPGWAAATASVLGSVHTRDELPPPADLVSFKSVLHDWPDADAERLLQRAWSVVRPGGRLMIFERAPIEMAGRPIPYCMAADLVFLHFLRPAQFYINILDRLGFTRVTPHRIELDMGFHLIVAERPQ